MLFFVRYWNIWQKEIILGLIKLVGLHGQTKNTEKISKPFLDVLQNLARDCKESELGCRYSSLLQLPYFDPVGMLIIDPMHNMYMGTAKYILNYIWIKRNIICSNDLMTINECMYIKSSFLVKIIIKNIY